MINNLKLKLDTIPTIVLMVVNKGDVDWGVCACSTYRNIASGKQPVGFPHSHYSLLLMVCEVFNRFSTLFMGWREMHFLSLDCKLEVILSHIDSERQVAWSNYVFGWQMLCLTVSRVAFHDKIFVSFA